MSESINRFGNISDGGSLWFLPLLNLLPVPIAHPEHVEAHDGRLPGSLYLDVVVGPGGPAVGGGSVH